MTLSVLRHGSRRWQVPIFAETKFEIASLSKQFRAAAILELADASKLNVEDPVSKCYPDSPTSWKGMTIHHLLTHISGLPENEPLIYCKGSVIVRVWFSGRSLVRTCLRPEGQFTSIWSIFSASPKPR